MPNDAAFRGFAALPETTGNGSAWWQELGVALDAIRDGRDAAYRALAKRWHPDMPGGDAERFHAIEAAYRQGIAASGSG